AGRIEASHLGDPEGYQPGQRDGDEQQDGDHHRRLGRDHAAFPGAAMLPVQNGSTPEMLSKTSRSSPRNQSPWANWYRMAAMLQAPTVPTAYSDVVMPASRR